MSLGKRLKQLRNEKGLTIRELAKLFNIGKTTVSNYENDERKPDYEMIHKFADFYNVSTDYLLGRTEHRNPAKKEYTIEELKKLAPDYLKDFFDKENLKYIKFANEMKEEDIDIDVLNKIKDMVIELKSKYKDE